MNEIFDSITSGEIALFGPLAFILGLGMVLTVGLLLPKSDKRLVRTPAALLGLYLVCRLLAWSLPAATDTKVLSAISTFLLLASLGRSGFLLVLHSIVARRLSGPVPRIIQDLIQVLIYGAVALVALSVVGVEPGSLLTTSALLTAVIGLSLQDTLGNLFSGLAIQAQQPFQVGDWIQFDADDSHVGRVTEMNWRAVTVWTLDDNEITVPNSALAKAALRNFTQPTRVVRRIARVYAPIQIRTRRVHRLLVDAVSDVPGVLWEPRPSVVTRSFHERGVEYEVRYFIDDFERREIIAGEVNDRIAYALRRARIEVPAPGRVVALHEVSEESRKSERESRVRAVRTALDRVDFLRVLPADAKDHLAQHADQREYVVGERIIVAGEESAELYIVESGEVRVEVRGGHRGTRQISLIGEGGFFGEMALMTGEQRRATVRATKETTVIVIEKAALQPLFETSPELAERISSVLEKRAEELEAMDADGTDPGVERREATGPLLHRIKRFFSIEGGDG